MPENFVQQYSLKLDQDQDILQSKKENNFLLEGNINLNGKADNPVAVLEIPELGITEDLDINGRRNNFSLQVGGLELSSRSIQYSIFPKNISMKMV